MVNSPFGGPADWDEIPTAASTPVYSPNRSPGKRFSRTAPSSVAGYLPPLGAAWPKGEDFGAFQSFGEEARPNTAPETDQLFVNRMSTPRHAPPPRPTTSQQSPRAIAAVRGGLALAAPAAHAIAMKQKQAFTRIQSQNESLMRNQLKMQGRMDIMEYETRCLRVRA